MTITQRDRRFLAWGGVSALLWAVMYLGPWTSGSGSAVPTPIASIESMEKDFARVRGLAAKVPQKEATLKAAQADLAKREAGLIQAPTAAQAKAQLFQILERLCAAETPPIRIVNDQLGRGSNALGNEYGAIEVSVDLQCSIEQLVNLLAAIAAQPELISTTDLRITFANSPKDKIMGVHLGVSGVCRASWFQGEKGAGRI